MLCLDSLLLWWLSTIWVMVHNLKIFSLVMYMDTVDRFPRSLGRKMCGGMN